MRNNSVIYSEDTLPDDYKSKPQLKIGGRVVGYYIEEGYKHRNCYVNAISGRIGVKAIRRHLIALAQMNRDIDVTVLMSEAQDYLKEKESGMMKYDDEFLLNIIDWAQHHEEDLFWIDKKYYFTVPLKRDIVLGIVQANGASLKRSKTIAAIEGGIEALKYDSVFISPKTLSEYSGVKRSTVLNYFGVFKEEIDKYNKINFKTDNYNEYVKNNSIEQMRLAYKRLGGITNKRKIAFEARVHHNTVGKLWEEAFNNNNNG